MALVHEEQMGNTVIRIHDDSCAGRTPEEIEQILRRIAFRTQAAIAAAEQKDQATV